MKNFAFGLWFVWFLFIINISDGYYTVWLEGYSGNLKLIELPDLTLTTLPALDLGNLVDITPIGLEGQCGNPDVSSDGKKIVFGAITPNTDSWDIYIGDLNIGTGRIDNLENIVNTSLREEDPRFSYDAETFVYKAGDTDGYNINMYNINNREIRTVVECSCNILCPSTCNFCELWGPAYHPCGNQISYTGRICENSIYYDELYVYDMDTNQETQITSNTDPDMYSHWTPDGRLIYSHNDGSVDNLYQYDGNSISLFLSETGSDDDVYAFKQDKDLLLFIGLADSVEGYELYVIRNESGSNIAYQLTSETKILGPVVFDLNNAAILPDYCGSKSPTQSPVDVPTSSPIPVTNSPTNDGNGYYTVWLEGYPGNLVLIPLPDLTLTTPTTLDLSNLVDITPSGLEGQCGTADVSSDGKTIVFGAITVNTDSWDIYIGDLNIETGTIDNLENIVNTALREEDPKFSYDASSIVYKSGDADGYNINMYDIETGDISTVVECSCDILCSSSCNHCELYNPSFHPCGNIISYTGRICENDISYDEIYSYNMDTNQQTQITDNTLRDRYSQWKRDGTLIYSHNDGSVDHLYSNSNLYLSETSSDLEAYPFKQDNNFLLFRGLTDANYELYVSRNNEAYQLTEGANVLGAVVFNIYNIALEPDYCSPSTSTSTPITSTPSKSTESTSEMTTSTNKGSDISSSSPSDTTRKHETDSSSIHVAEFSIGWISMMISIQKLFF